MFLMRFQLGLSPDLCISQGKNLTLETKLLLVQITTPLGSYRVSFLAKFNDVGCNAFLNPAVRLDLAS
jgi:hypothetical protein